MRKIIFVFTTTLLASACPKQDSTPDATPCPMDIELGAERVEGFEAFTTGESAELTVGFQDFIYISASVRLSADEAAGEDQGQLVFQIEIDAEDAYSFKQPFEALDAEADGWRYNDDIRVFFNQFPVPTIVGKEATITARGSLGNCIGLTSSARVTLVDEKQCIEQPDGSLLCDE
ncbi:MAG: hypothetical protein GY811_16220 [Myxococcales bacterium]|nr:hypothetical protein [Myxococcales bacterium]